MFQNGKNIIPKVMAEDINRMNKILVLNLIRQEGEISRAEIVKESGLSAPTVTRIVDSLINNEGLALQVGIGESSGGRPPVIVRFNGEGNFVIGVDWGRTHIHGVVANLNAETIFSLDVPVSSEGNFKADIERLISLIKNLISDSGVDAQKILGIGLAVAGYINQKSNKVEYSPNFGWSNLNVKEYLREHFNIPIIVDNVSRVMALGELWYGIGNKIKNFVFANIGYGIGAGIIADGKPFTGFDGFAGEIGHNRISSRFSTKKTRTCSCGKFDCLECFASGRGIAQTAKNTLAENKDSKLNILCQGNVALITTEMIAQAAREGDIYSRKLIEEAGTMLGVAFANVSNIINPEAIVIGGKVANTGDYFIERIQKTFDQETLQRVSRPVRILKSHLLGKEAVKGAVALTLKEILNLNIKT